MIAISQSKPSKEIVNKMDKLGVNKSVERETRLEPAATCLEGISLLVV